MVLNLTKDKHQKAEPSGEDLNSVQGGYNIK